jgi:hypothetical protein
LTNKKGRNWPRVYSEKQRTAMGCVIVDFEYKKISKFG